MGAVTVYLGLGSNLGQRENNLADAIRLLAEGPPPPMAGSTNGGSRDELGLDEIEIKRISSVYETVPWGYHEQPRFLNCVLEAHTNLPPEELLERIKAIEQSVGRQPSVRYGPRVIDVDILLYSDQVIDRPYLQIPHPRLHQRAFALVPLAELRPDLAHPVLKTAIGVLVSQVDGQDGVSPWGPLLIETS